MSGESNNSGYDYDNIRENSFRGFVKHKWPWKIFITWLRHDMKVYELRQYQMVVISSEQEHNNKQY